MGAKIDVLDYRPVLFPDLERPYYLIQLWIIGRREYDAMGKPRLLSLRAIRDVFDCFELAPVWSFDEFAGYALALDRAAMDAMTKTNSKKNEHDQN